MELHPNLARFKLGSRKRRPPQPVRRLGFVLRLFPGLGVDRRIPGRCSLKMAGCHSPAVNNAHLPREISGALESGGFSALPWPMSRFSIPGAIEGPAAPCGDKKGIAKYGPPLDCSRVNVWFGLDASVHSPATELKL